MSLIIWLIFGATIGVIASIITGKTQSPTILSNSIVGMVGVLFGGTVAGMTGQSGSDSFSISSIIVALAGAILLISIVNLFDRGSNINIREE